MKIEKLEDLKSKTLGFFMTRGMSFKRWYEIGMFDREISLYNRLADYYERIYIFSYGNRSEFEFQKYLKKNIEICPLNSNLPVLFQELFLPFKLNRPLKQCDIYKTNQMDGATAGIIARILYKKPLIIRMGWVRSLNISKNESMNIVKRLILNLNERWACKYSDAVMVSSEQADNYIVKKYQLNNKLRLVNKNFVDVKLFKALNISKDRDIIFIGRLSEEKNLFGLLNALKDSNYNLDIIGSGPLKQALEEKAKKDKLNVRFLGNIPNSRLPEIINRHKIFILPSYYEGAPKSLLEAMSCGLAVIGTNVIGIREVITNDIDGILCGTDSDSIRFAIDRLMRNSELRYKLGEKAREKIVREFSFEKVLDREIEFSKKVIEKFYSKMC